MRLVPTLAEDDAIAQQIAARPSPSPLQPAASDAPAAEWPVEAEMILSAMDAGHAMQSGKLDRRDVDRAPHHTRAELRLFADDPIAPPTALFTRDISADGIGFITRERLPLGYGGIVAFEQADGTNVAAACTIFRCRASINGWFEGALHFTG